MLTYNNDASATESELDDEEAEFIGLVNKVPLSFNMYRDYLLWQTKHKVSVEKVKTGWKELVEPAEQVELGLDDLLGS